MNIPRKRKKPDKKPQSIGQWPDDAPTPAQVAEAVVYIGSPDHKDYVNPVNDEPPHARPESDGFRCERYPKEQWVRFTELLRKSVEMGCTSAAFDADQTKGIANAYPRYVWGWFGDRIFEARHRTDPPGNRYKGYLLEPHQLPDDPEKRLDALKAVLILEQQPEADH